MNEISMVTKQKQAESAEQCRENSAGCKAWAKGYGVISHSDLTQVRMYEKMKALHQSGALASIEEGYRLLWAADRLCSASMWLVVHATYASQVYLDGREMEAQDFKPHPEGHTGGSLNMVPGYVGYLLANALSGVTRSFMMGQGHCVSAIDSTNVLVDNMTSSHAARYGFSEKGLTQFVKDFYSYQLTSKGTLCSPLGSHVNAHTAGGMLEGGFLGFAELQYVHVPLRNERLVVFLSDGAFEEQRGSDWTPRWWRASDSGLVSPILIANGRRIEQRSMLSQEGGVPWIHDHLKLNGFDPIEIDGRDPAALCWAILEMEERLQKAGDAALRGEVNYPIPFPYTVADTIKGYGFYGAGTNAAHNLPLGRNPYEDASARKDFQKSAQALWVSDAEVNAAVSLLNNHARTGRVKERDHICAHREVSLHDGAAPPFCAQGDELLSPMSGIDGYFHQMVLENQELRVRVGNPDELRSNGMSQTLDFLKHRVTQPEPSVSEAVDGAVITALNEEAVICAAFGNKGGLNLVVTYEAFAPKMLGAIRQELTFSRAQRQAGTPALWLSVPLILTSHTFENGKNEQSHQDPTLCEALLSEMSDVSHVLFPADYNSALASLQATYRSKGEIWTMVIPKRPVPSFFTKEQADELVREGAICVRGKGSLDETVLIIAVGAYQLEQAMLVSKRLDSCAIPHRVIYMIEPGKFREARDAEEEKETMPLEKMEGLFPASAHIRIFLGHTHPHVLLGVLRKLDTGAKRTYCLGYINQGGTLDTQGMLFRNKCTYAHALLCISEAMSRPSEDLLTREEQDVLKGIANPSCLLVPQRA